MFAKSRRPETGCFLGGVLRRSPPQTGGHNRITSGARHRSEAPFAAEDVLRADPATTPAVLVRRRCLRLRRHGFLLAERRDRGGGLVACRLGGVVVRRGRLCRAARSSPSHDSSPRSPPGCCGAGEPGARGGIRLGVARGGVGWVGSCGRGGRAGPGTSAPTGTAPSSSSPGCLRSSGSSISPRPSRSWIRFIQRGAHQQSSPSSLHDRRHQEHPDHGGVDQQRGDHAVGDVLHHHQVGERERAATTTRISAAAVMMRPVWRCRCGPPRRSTRRGPVPPPCGTPGTPRSRWTGRRSSR